MKIDTIIKIKNNKIIYNFLRENSYYYKELNRNPFFYKELFNISKKYYKLDLNGKINNFKDKLKLVNTFVDIIK